MAQAAGEPERRQRQPEAVAELEDYMEAEEAEPVETPTALLAEQVAQAAKVSASCTRTHER